MLAPVLKRTMIDEDDDVPDADYEQAFPARLHYLLDVLEKDGLAHVCSFQSHGRAFVVRDKEAFVKDILPKWFRQNRWASFQRQLNHYEFQRITAGPDQGAYYHPHFLRGIEHRDRCRFIRRIKVKGLGPRKPGSPATEPNFYKFPPLHGVVVRPSRTSQAIGSPSSATSGGTPRASPPIMPHFGVRGLETASGHFSGLDSSAWTSNAGSHGMPHAVGGSSGLCAGAPWMTSPPPQALWNMAADAGSFPGCSSVGSWRPPSAAVTGAASFPFTMLRASQLFAMATAIASGDAIEEGPPGSQPTPTGLLSRGPWLVPSSLGRRPMLSPVGPGWPTAPGPYRRSAPVRLSARSLGLPSE